MSFLANYRLTKLIVRLSFFLLVLITFQCNRNIELPEYLTYDWFDDYSLGPENYKIKKNGLSANLPPYLESYNSYGTVTNPDGSEDITFLQLHTTILTQDEDTGNDLFINYQITLKSKTILDLDGATFELKRSTLIDFLLGREFSHKQENQVEEDYIIINASDHNGIVYTNVDLNDGGYLSLRDYKVTFVAVQEYSHPDLGEILKIRAAIVSSVFDSNSQNTRELNADVQTYIVIPFE